jgi:two-component system sensor histidine kinase CpxA
MKTIWRRLLLWFGVALLIGVFGFIYIQQSPRHEMRWKVFQGIDQLHLAQGAEMYQEKGREGLAAWVNKINEHIPGKRSILDWRGVDLVTGQDRSADVKEAKSRGRNRGWFIPPERILFARWSEDGKYILLAEVPLDPNPVLDLAPFAWLAVLIGVLSYALAASLANPIRHLRDTVARFGSGDLSARAEANRKDEIGDLARTFNQMGDRIQTLLAAERRLLQDVSHELRSPLARLNFAVELARSGKDPKESLERIKKESDRMSALIGELLQITRAEGDPDSKTLEPLDLGEFVGDLVEDCRLEAEASCVTVAYEGRDGVRWRGDRELLHRAVENVLRNSLKYAPESSTVTVSLTRDGNRAVISVRDQGPGVPEELLGRIFDPFFRVDEDRSRASGGTGLGLSIARRAVEVYGGEIRARNVSPGLLVEIRLPL